MADVYRFKVRLRELEDYIWRDIEITSVSTVAKLGYAILAAFEAEGSHLFCMKFGDERYEIVFDDIYEDFDIEVTDPTSVKLSSLKLKAGDSLSLEYDYGASWVFDIEFLSSAPMKKGMGTHYPYITDGMGWGIIEDTCPEELLNQIKTNEIRNFDLETSNYLLKGMVQRMQESYEDLDEWD